MNATAPAPWRVRAASSAGAAIAVFFALAANGAESASGAPCSPLEYEKARYTVCEARLDRYSVRLFWRKPDGSAYAYLSSLPNENGNGEKLAFALNGGMFHDSLAPVGLYIEDGRELVRANTNAGRGNFHLRPNGVFYIGENGAGVMETGAFLKAKPKAVFATQSGPMLVVNGKLHPRLVRAGTSAKRRDGVCVREGKVAVFAISHDGVPFNAFMRLFRDKLGCRNALFLDGGSAPALYEPSGSHNGNAFRGLGPMIAVYEKR